jgi:small-conductance mechanosensitive channel
MDVIFWGNRLLDYVVAASVFVVLSAVFFVLHRYVFARCDSAIKKYKSKRQGTYAVAHALLMVPLYVLIILALYIAMQFVVLPEKMAPVASVLFIIFVVFWASSVLSTFFVVLVMKLNRNADEKSLRMTKNIVKLLIKVVIWITAILLVLINLGIEITPLLASLWIGWIAIAFALQNILQDVFASFSIFFEKPFSIGDVIVIGDTRWTVNHISFKSTYVQALEWQMIIVPNKEVMNTRIQNYGAMKRRWHKQTIGVLYETSIDKLHMIPQFIQEEIDRIEDISFHRAHVKELGAYSVDIEFAYYIESKEFVFFLDKNQELLISILRRFADEWIGIAYPTQLVYTQWVK